MREYTFVEKRVEGFYRPLNPEEKEHYSEEYEVEITMDMLTREEVDELRKIIREVAARA